MLLYYLKVILSRLNPGGPRLIASFRLRPFGGVHVNANLHPPGVYKENG